MKLLVIGGTHGNETLGIELVRLLEKAPIEGIDSLIANPRAVKARERYTETDLNRSFGVRYPKSYEERRAKELVDITRRYDIVLDFHNTETPGNNICFTSLNPSLELLNAAKRLGFNRYIQATYDCINKYCLNTVSIEISFDDELDNAGLWYDRLSKYVPTSSLGADTQMTRYVFQSRVTWEDKMRHRLEWNAFVPISANDKAALGVQGDLTSVFVGSSLTPYYATIIEKQS